MSKLPSQIYRYMDEEHVNDFIKTGRIRIGTLFKYKDITCEIRVDKYEGTVFTGRLVDGKDSSGAVIQDVIHRIIREYKNQFVLSYSLEHSARLMNHFNTTSCLIINEPEKFHHALTKAIRVNYNLISEKWVRLKLL